MSVDEPSIQESAESDQSARACGVRILRHPPYGAQTQACGSAGSELFDADGVKLEPSDVLTERQRNADDDKRILGELPPHWGVFSERER